MVCNRSRQQNQWHYHYFATRPSYHYKINTQKTNNMKKLVLRTGLSALAILIVAASSNVGGVAAISASNWKPGRIIDDSIFTNKNDMTIEQVQQFLNSKVPNCDTQGTKSYGGTSRAAYGASRGNPIPFTCLKDYHEVPKTAPGPGLPASNYGGQPIPAGAKSAAHLIWEAAQAYDISPRVLLVTLHKESGLISDDWPFKSQFTYAMGSHCPDSTGCDPNYGGFSLQMREGAAMFRGYINNMSQPWWPYRKPNQNNVIAYNPNGACGGSDVFITSKATAALYTYTPYQPNQAALNAGYGTGDACSAYGNRNFWLFFNDWFGSSIDLTFQLAISDDGNPTQYVLYNNLKQAIPHPDIKAAWGMQDLPLTTVSAGYLATLVNGPALDVVFRVNGGTTVYMADNGKKYPIGSPDMLKAWGLEGKAISNVTTGLGNTPQDGGALTYTVRPPASSAVYMVDGVNGSNQPVLRQYTNANVLTAIEGDTPKVIDLSAMRFDAMNNAIGSVVNTTKAAYGGQEYQMLAGQRMPQPIGVAPLYPSVATSISGITFNRLLPTAQATALVRSNASPNVYLLDSGTKKLVTNPDMLKSWTPQGQYVNTANEGFMNLIPNGGSNVDSYIAAGSSQFVMANGSKMPIPSELSTGYAGNTKGTHMVSPTLEALFPTANASASAFVKSSDSDRLYLLDNSSVLRALPSPAEAEAWGATQSNITTVSPAALSTFTQGATAGLFVTDGTTEYVLSKGKKLTLDAGAKEEWGLAGKTPQAFTDGTLNRVAAGGALETKAKDARGFYLIRDGKAYYTVDQNIAGVWGIQNATADYQTLFNRLAPVEMLTRFVVSNTDAGAIYAVDANSWYSLTAAHATNFNVATQPKMALNPNNAPAINAWSSAVLKDATNTYFVVDEGGKRTFNHPVILNHWTNNQTLNVPNVSQAFTNLLPTKGAIERAIKGSGAAVYSAEGATKRWITSPTTFNQQYAPFAQVSDALLQAMPSGNNIP
jgi:hypothetical protein